RQAVAPLPSEDEVVCPAEGVFEGGPASGHERAAAVHVGLELRLPAGQPFIELGLARLHGRDVAAREEHLDGKRHHGRVRREAKPGHWVLHHGDEVGPRQRDGGNSQRFDPGGRPAARGGARPSGRVADDDGVDPAPLHLLRRLLIANEGIALRKSVDGQYLDAGEIALEEGLEEWQHAEGLPLLVAYEPDTLARETIESRRVWLPRFQPSGRIVELEGDHRSLLVCARDGSTVHREGQTAPATVSTSTGRQR